MRSRFLATATALVIGVAAPAFADERATATGAVTDAAGAPLEHATVLVYEARVKKGYSIYCPTCWVDCGKHAFTDAAGRYTIAGLNPDLHFKLLVLKDGRSEEHTSELQSLRHLVCRLLLEKKTDRHTGTAATPPLPSRGATCVWPVQP